MDRGSVVVTGAGSGIGFSTAELLIEAGWHVVAADRDASAIDRLMDRLDNKAAMVTPVAIDITDEAAIIKGNLGRSAYGASKGALITLTKIMAVELADDLIRVNAIAPGPIETPMVRENHTAATREEWQRTVPMRRYGRPEEIASAIAFLIDGRQSSYVTGQVLSVDGGFTAAGLMN